MDGWLMSVGHYLISNKKKLKPLDQGKDLTTTALNNVIDSKVLNKAL